MRVYSSAGRPCAEGLANSLVALRVDVGSRCDEDFALVSLKPTLWSKVGAQHNPHTGRPSSSLHFRTPERTLCRLARICRRQAAQPPSWLAPPQIQIADRGVT